MLNATFRQLEVFVAAVEAGSLAKAADRLGISQPGLSRHIKALEEQCGTGLFVRNAGRSMQLTAAGTLLMGEVPGILLRASILEERLREVVSRNRERPARVTGHPYVMTHLIRPLLADFTAAHPGLSVACLPLNGEVLRLRSAMTYADVAFLVAADRGAADFSYLCAVPCELVVGSNHPLARKSGLSLKHIQNSSFVLPLAGSTFEGTVLAMLGQLGCGDIKVAARAQEVEVIKDLVKRGVGIAYLPMNLTMAEIAAGSLFVLPLAVPPLHVGSVSVPEAEAGVASRSFLSFVRQRLGQSLTPQAAPQVGSPN